MLTSDICNNYLNNNITELINNNELISCFLLKQDRTEFGKITHLGETSFLLINMGH